MKKLKHRKNLAEWPSSAKIRRLRNICGVHRYYIFLWDSAPPQKIYCSKFFAELSLSHSPDLDRYLEMKLSQDIIAVQCIREIGECYDICIPNTARECIREIVLSQDRNISQATFARVLSCNYSIVLPQGIIAVWYLHSQYSETMHTRDSIILRYYYISPIHTRDSTISR